MPVSQLWGTNPNSALAEVEANTRAILTRRGANDCGKGGQYVQWSRTGTIGGVSWTTPNGLLFSFRWTHASKVALIHTIRGSLSNVGTAATAGAGNIQLFVARSFTVSDSAGGGNLTPQSVNGRMRPDNGNSAVADWRLAQGGALTAGTRTVDTNPLASVAFGVHASASVNYFDTIDIWKQRPGEHPIVLAANEGIILTMTFPASGNFDFSLYTRWDEDDSY